MWYCDASSWAGVSCEKVGLQFSGQGHSKDPYDKDMTVSAVFSELVILFLLNFFYIFYHKPECLVKKLDCCVLAYCIESQGHSEESKCQCFSRLCLLNGQTFYYQAWYFDALSWAGVSCKKIGLLFSRSKSQQRIDHMIKIWQFQLHFWTADPFATKLCWTVHYQKPECLMK